MDVPLKHLRRTVAALFGTLLALFLATAGPDYLALIEGKIHTEDPIFSRQVLEYEHNADGSVTYDYLSEALPPLLDPKEDPALRTEYSYTKYLGTNEKGESVYELIAYTDKTYAWEGGQWFARETATTDRATFAAARQRDPIAGLFWERAVATDYYAGAGDGSVLRSATTIFSNCQSNSTGTTADPTSTDFSASSYWEFDVTNLCQISQAFIPFNTAAIPVSATITAAVLNLYATVVSSEDDDGNDFITVLQTSQNSHTTLILGDYNNIGSTEGIDSGQRKDVTTITQNAYLAFTLNATGRGWIAKSGETSNCSATTGITCLGLREGHDLLNDSPVNAATIAANFSSSEAAGTSQDPYLSVTYTRVALSKPPNNLGLVGYWSFNEATSTRATDYSGSGNNGTLSTTLSALPSWTNGSRGAALSFDGTSQYVDVGTGLNSLTTSSICAWIYPRGWGESSFGRIFSARTGSTAGYEFNLNNSSITAGIALDHTGSGSLNSNNNVISLNTWQHVCAVYDASGGTGAFYVNGSSAGSGSIPAVITPSGNATIGKRSSDNLRYFDGIIDEVRIYNRALTAPQVVALYGSGAIRLAASSKTLDAGSTLRSGLVGHWTFDGSEVNWTSNTTGFAADASGNGNTATITNMSRGIAAAIGKLGQGFSFDGSDDYLQAIFEYTAPTQGTVALWMKPTVGGGSRRVFGSQDDFEFLIQASGTLQKDICETSTGASNSTLATGVWRHVVVTWDDTTNTQRIYFDGVLDDEETTVPFDCTLLTGADLYIGWRPAASAAERYLGVMDDVRLYNRVLTVAEIQQLYRLGAATIRP